jgi:eukaryotic-like serine/threonine-protein kinase
MKENFHISSDYYDDVEGDLQKASQIYQEWAATYPQDPLPLERLGSDYLALGQYQQALEVLLEEKKLTEGSYYNYSNLATAYVALNRLKEARSTVEEAFARKLEPALGYGVLYLVDFLEANSAGMNSKVTWASGKPGVEDLFLGMQSDTEAYSGPLKAASEFSHRAASAAQRDGENEVAAIHLATAALQQAEVGNFDRAFQNAKSALDLAPSREVKTLVAVAFARAGFPDRANILGRELAKANPSNTLLNFFWLPTARAAVEVDLGHPEQALELLEPVAPYELGGRGPSALYPVYVRGQAYMRLGKPAQAAAEFQKLLDHPGCVLNFPLGALARLQLARAYALAGDSGKARTAYHAFLLLWKDADVDVPVLKQAKLEYARLE